jgi:hypothetical protein
VPLAAHLESARLSASAARRCRVWKGCGHRIQLVLQVTGQPQVRDFDALGILDRDKLLALGDISEYDAGPQAREAGRRFSITGLVPRSSFRAPA